MLLGMNPSIVLGNVLLLFPLVLSAQRLELTDTTLNTTSWLFVSDMELDPGTGCIMSGTSLNFASPADPGAGYIASVYLDSCDWAQGLFVKWSRTLSDTSLILVGDSNYVREDGSILGCTVLEDGTMLACGSVGHVDRSPMVALLEDDGDTAWTTAVLTIAAQVWFRDAQQAADGSIYCVGTLLDDSLSSYDPLIARFSATGELLWFCTVEFPGVYYDTGEQCFPQGDTLVVFCSTGEAVGPDSLNVGDISVLRFSSSGELLDSRLLDTPDHLTYGKVVRDGNGGFFLCTSYLPTLDSDGAECGILHLNAALDTVGVPMKASFLHDIDGFTRPGMVYDASSGKLFIGGAGETGVGTFCSFALGVPLAQPAAAWGRLVQDVPIFFGGMGLTDDNTRLRLLVSQIGSGRTYVHSWEAATGRLGQAATCEWETFTWNPAIEPWDVQIAEAPVVLSEPSAQGYHGLTFGDHTWIAEVCPDAPPPDACSVGQEQPAEAPTTHLWPNPAAPGELVRFAGQAQVYDALGRTIRTNVMQMAAPEQPGCYLVVTGERRAVLVVR